MSVAEVAAWLRTTFAANASFAPVIGQYVAAFAESNIDGETLSDLSKDDLSGVGIANAAHRTLISKKWAAAIMGVMNCASNFMYYAVRRHYRRPAAASCRE